MLKFRPLLELTPSFPLVRLPNHKSEHLEHLRNKVIKINVKLLYEVYSPEWAIRLKSYSSFLCYMIIYFSMHLLSLSLVLDSKVLRIQIDGAVWQFPCWVIITMDVFPFFPTGAVLHSQICCKKSCNWSLLSLSFSLFPSGKFFHFPYCSCLSCPLVYMQLWYIHRREKEEGVLNSVVFLHWVMEREREAVVVEVVGGG